MSDSLSQRCACMIARQRAQLAEAERAAVAYRERLGAGANITAGSAMLAQRLRVQPMSAPPRRLA